MMGTDSAEPSITLREGIVFMKCGRGFFWIGQKFRRRYLKLSCTDVKSQQLRLETYEVNDSLSSCELSEVIDLDQVRTVLRVGKEKFFAVNIYAKRRVIQLRCESETDVQRWISAIKNVFWPLKPTDEERNFLISVLPSKATDKLDLLPDSFWLQFGTGRLRFLGSHTLAPTFGWPIGSIKKIVSAEPLVPADSGKILEIWFFWKELKLRIFTHSAQDVLEQFDITKSDLRKISVTTASATGGLSNLKSIGNHRVSAPTATHVGIKQSVRNLRLFRKSLPAILSPGRSEEEINEDYSRPLSPDTRDKFYTTEHLPSKEDLNQLEQTRLNQLSSSRIWSPNTSSSALDFEAAFYRYHDNLSRSNCHLYKGLPSLTPNRTSLKSPVNEHYNVLWSPPSTNDSCYKELNGVQSVSPTSNGIKSAYHQLPTEQSRMISSPVRRVSYYNELPVQRNEADVREKRQAIVISPSTTHYHLLPGESTIGEFHSIAV